MPVLRFRGFPHTPIYHGPTGSWSVGDEREVEAVEAARLLADFGAAFVVVGSAPIEPPKMVAVKSPKRRAAPSKE